MGMDKATVKACERSHYLMQLGTYFTELVDLTSVRLAHTSYLADQWYNQAYDIMIQPGEDTDRVIKAVEEHFLARDRAPFFYLTPSTSPENFADILIARGYVLADEEAWMFYNGLANERPETAPNGITVTPVTTESEFKIFTDLYAEGLPGPEVRNYIREVADSFHFSPGAVRIVHYFACFEDAPAGIVSWFGLGKYAGVYDVATIEKYQRKGIMTALVSRAVQDAQSQGAKHVFLQTGKGDDSEAALRRVGFQTEFVRLGYVAQEYYTEEHG